MTNGDGASLAIQTAEQAAKASIPVAASGALILGVTLQDWMVIFTIVYTILQIGALVWSWFNKKKAKVDGSA